MKLQFELGKHSMSLHARRWFWIAITAFIVGLFFAIFSPGLELFNPYTMLVKSPEKLEPVFGIPFTYNPGWLVAILAPFVWLPGRIGLILFIAVTILLIIASTTILKGRAIPVLVSAQMAWILWWSQIEAFIIFGVALGWIALKRRSWRLMFLAMSLATIKPQVGLVAILVLWWWLGRQRWKALLAYLVLVAVSILIWGPWPYWFLKGAFAISARYEDYGLWNSSLGIIALPLFLPALLIPLDREQRLIAVTATALLCSPYMPYYSTILLLCMSLPWWAYSFAFLPYLPNLVGTVISWNGVVLLPITTLIWLYIPFIRSWLNNRVRALRYSGLQ